MTVEQVHRNECGSGQVKIAVLGGDGFVGWPTSLHLSDKGHDVHIIDNLSRRWIDTELGRPVADADGFHPGTHPDLACRKPAARSIST
jgi:nucleoside-diphosphate-sugar epimerase